MFASTSLRTRYAGGASFERFLTDVSANVELWQALARRTETPDSVVRDVESDAHGLHPSSLTTKAPTISVGAFVRNC